MTSGTYEVRYLMGLSSVDFLMYNNNNNNAEYPSISQRGH